VPIVQVKILSTSDVHGYYQADDYQRPIIDAGIGLARAKTAIDQVRQAAQPDDFVLTIDDGDFIQGSPLTNYVHKVSPDDAAIYQQLADEVGYDVRVLGNHEFNYGRNYLEAVIPASAGLLNANVLDENTHEPFIGKPYHVFEQDDVRVAVIGVTTKFIPNWEQPEHIRGLIFADPVEVTKEIVHKIQDEVDVIVVAYHGGFAEDPRTGLDMGKVNSENQAYQLLKITGVDAVVTGHQHCELAEVVEGVPTTQPGYRGNAVGLMALTLDDGKRVVSASAELVDTRHLPEDSGILAIVQPLDERVNAWLDARVGHVGPNMAIQNHMQARLFGHPFLTLVNDVQMQAGGTDIALTALFNNGMSGLSDSVSLRDVMTNYVYPNTLVVEKLTGSDIKAALEQSARYFQVVNDELIINPRFLHPKVQHYNYDIWTGLDYTVDYSRPMTDRVVAITYHGAPLDMTATYEVAMNNYRGNGSGNFKMFSGDKIIREVQRETADLIGDYLLDHPDINIAQPTNITPIGFTTIEN
jgi:2',3'-cyclic-nucleotide 2'-phosphodiesterase/3'-nucleotidase